MKMKFIVCMSAIFCCLLFAGTVSKASQVQPTPTPVPQWGEELEKPKLARSGNYTYQVINEKEKKIAVRYVHTVGEKLEIPAQIDGYQVDTVGVPYIGNEEKMREIYGDGDYSIIQSEKEKLKELTIPEGVRYLGQDAFRGCFNLSKLNLPSNPITLGAGTFADCKSLTHFVFRNSTTLYEAALSKTGVIEKIVMPYTVLDQCGDYDAFFGDTTIKRVYIPKTKAKEISLGLFCKKKSIDEIVVDGKLNTLIVMRPYNPQGITINKLVVNYKNTKLVFAKDDFAEGPDKVTLNAIYTVSGAKAISFAKARKATHYVKKTGKTQVVKGKKAKKGYKASWKKVKTTITTNKYKTVKKKWSKSTKAVKTVYQVYGKKTKTGKYQFIKTTKSKKLVSKYKYVKVVPKQTW